MTAPSKEDQQDLDKVLSHLETRVEKFKELKKAINEMVAEGIQVYLDAPPDSNVVTVRAERKRKPTGPLIKLLEIQDSNEKIEYDYEDDKYSLTAKLYIDR